MSDNSDFWFGLAWRTVVILLITIIGAVIGAVVGLFTGHMINCAERGALVGFCVGIFIFTGLIVW